MPPAKIVKDDFHFSITHAVWVGGTSIAYCDGDLRADLVRRAFNVFRKSPEGKRWWAEQQKRDAHPIHP